MILQQNFFWSGRSRGIPWSLLRAAGLERLLFILHEKPVYFYDIPGRIVEDGHKKRIRSSCRVLYHR